MRVPRGVFGPGCRQFLARAAFDANFGPSFEVAKIDMGVFADPSTRRGFVSRPGSLGVLVQLGARLKPLRRKASSEFFGRNGPVSAPAPQISSTPKAFSDFLGPALSSDFIGKFAQPDFRPRPARGPAAPGFPMIEHAQRSREFFETRGDGAGCSDDTAKRSARFFKGAGGICGLYHPARAAGLLSIRQYSARYYCIRTTPEGGK